MKLFQIFLLLPLTALSCEHSPLENLRKQHTLEELQRFKDEKEITMGMYNHAIAHNDVELLELFFSRRDGKNTKVVYEDLRLSQADRQGAEPIYFSPLHLAAQYGALDVVLFCLNHKADINSLTESRTAEYHHNTPAYIATLFGKKQVLIALLSQGASLDIKNGVGKTLTQLARDKDDKGALSIITTIRENRERIALEQRAEKPQ